MLYKNAAAHITNITETRRPFLLKSSTWGSMRRTKSSGSANGLYDIYPEKSRRRREKIALVEPQAGQGKPVMRFIGQ